MSATADRLFEMVRVLAIGYTAHDVLRAAMLLAVALLALAVVAVAAFALNSLAALRTPTRRGSIASRLAHSLEPGAAAAAPPTVVFRDATARAHSRPHHGRISMAPVAR